LATPQNAEVQKWQNLGVFCRPNVTEETD